MQIDTLIIRRPDDLHIHFRTGPMLRKVVPFSARHWARALVMPNTDPPITNGDYALQYSADIKLAAEFHHHIRNFEPLMTIKILPSTTPQIIRQAKKYGVIAGKIYPEGVTTNSNDGVRDFKALSSVFEAMQEVDMVLCLHGETPDSFVLDREHDFLQTLVWINSHFPNLRIVLEHITTAEAVYVVNRLSSKVAATITIHHLLISLHEVLCWKTEKGEFLNPHHYCKPVAKTRHDRSELQKAAASGNPKFFYGGDSAPWQREKKESDCGCAGVFNAPVALPLLVQFFESSGDIGKLENFVSRFGAEFYGLPLNEGTITLEKRSWRVPKEYDGIVPFWAGKEISWSVKD